MAFSQSHAIPPTGEWSRGSDRVIRGGSWNNQGVNCMASNRNRNEPGNANQNLGFRLLAAPQFVPLCASIGTDRFPVLLRKKAQMKGQ